MIRERFNIPKLSGSSLRIYYHKAGIKYTRPNYRIYKSNAEMNDLRGKQQEFVMTLGTIMRDEAYDEIIYVDETTFNLW